jgi:hypothetical protein
MTRIDMPGYGLLTEPPSASDWPTCACCGTELPADGSWCAECEAAECGERDWNDPNIGTCRRARPALALTDDELAKVTR